MTCIRGALAPKSDMRDYQVCAAGVEYPKSYSINYLPPVKNQKNVSSCVAHASSSILEYFVKDEANEELTLSTNFIYGMQGVALGRAEPGMYLRDACKIMKEYGNPEKSLVPGNTEQPKCTEELSKLLTEEIYDNAKCQQIRSYARCYSENAIKHALMNYGPVLASVKWYDKYETDGKVIYMDPASGYGYHAIVIYGWNEQGWLCQNSWGKSWNGDGRFIYPFEDELTEAWSLVDETNEDIYIPKRNKILDIIYKIINAITNFIEKFKGE